MNKGTGGRKLWVGWLVILILCFLSGLARADRSIRVGSPIPKVQLKVPEGKGERLYLEIGNTGRFFLQQIPAQFLIIEILGVYCPLCHTQGPFFNRVFHQIQKDPSLNKKIKMLAVAAGANATEIAYIKQVLQIPFPVLEDPKFDFHKILGEPKTPATLIVNREGKLVFFHVGVLDDFDAFYNTIKNLTN
jgi:hypothetical protein